VFVLLMMQSMLWAIAGLSAIPFALAGEVFMLGWAGLAAPGAGDLPARDRRAVAAPPGPTLVFALEITCFVGSLLLLLVPIGANHGPVSLMTNLALPIAVVLLLRQAQGGLQLTRGRERE